MNLIIIFISFQIEEDEPMLSYDTEGNVNGGEFRVNTNDNADDDEDDEESEEEKSAAKGDDESDEDEEDSGDEEEEADDEEKDEESDDNDSLNDLRLKDSDQEEEASDAEDEIQVAAESKPEKKLKAVATPDFKQLKDMMEQARKELPFTFAGKIQVFFFGSS